MRCVIDLNGKYEASASCPGYALHKAELMHKQQALFGLLTAFSPPCVYTVPWYLIGEKVCIFMCDMVSFSKIDPLKWTAGH